MRTRRPAQLAHPFVVVACVACSAMYGCSQETEIEQVEFCKSYDFHDLKEDDPIRRKPVTPPAVEIVRPTPGQKIKPNETLDVVVRVRFVGDSRIPASACLKVQGGRGPSGRLSEASRFLERFRKEGEDYLCEFQLPPPEGGWINDARGHVAARVYMNDVMTIWDGQKPTWTPRVRHTPWEFKPTFLQVTKP